MSSEVCPFCGKTYKRLKSHLPHCKAAPSSKTPPTKRDVTVNQTTSSSQLAAALSESAAKSTQTLSITASPQSEKSKKARVVSSAATQSPSPSSASLPPSAKKKKQKLSEQIKTASTPSSTTTSLTSSPSLSLSPPVSKPKKQSLRALIEKSKQVSKGSLEGTTSASEDQTQFVADPLSSRTTAETKTNPVQDTEDNTRPALLPTDTKPKAASKMKVSKTKKAAQPLSTTKHTPSSLDSKVNESSVRDDSWVNNNGEVEDLSVNKMFLKSGGGHQAGVTLQDVKAMLGRANASRRSSRPSILSQIQTTDDPSSKVRLGTSLSAVQTGNQDSCLVTSKTVSDQLSSTQHTERQPVKRKSKQASLVPLQQPELASPAAPLLSGHVSSQVSKATPPPHTVNEGPKVTGLLTVSPPLTQFSSPLPAARVETFRADDALKSQLVAKQSTADKGTKGALTQRSLGQVRLRELPAWLLARKTPSHPKEVVEMVQRGWQWYYKKYIDVKKGGVGGVGMLLAGYCVLSYIWSYPHIKRDRWRKYH